ncbi:MAG TPA: hypothetical protein VFV94_06845, partial [Polyangiaceae bacterium]|nr:hypothetical protein [Polyangiaceae bacterium]
MPLMRLAPPAWLLFAAFLSACSSDSSTPTAPPPKVTLRVSALLPVGEAAWYEPAPEEWTQPVVSIGCDRTLGVLLTVENFSLRAPGACNGAVQCGYDQVTLLGADDASVVAGPVQSASNVPLLELAGLEPLDGDYFVRPELLTAVGTVYQRNYAELPVDLPVTLVDACDPNGAGGAGG